MSDNDFEFPEGPGWDVPDDLSGLLDGDTGTTDLPSQSNSVEVIATVDLLADGAAPYITTVQPTDDVSIVLPYDKAVGYGMAVLAAAYRSEYLAAVNAQARDIVGGRRGRRPADPDPAELDEIATLIGATLREDLPELDRQATDPLLFLPVWRRADRRPMVRVSLPPHTEPLTVWTVPEALDHGHAVLAQAVMSQLDTAYRTCIAVTFDVGEQRGRAAVADLANYYWDKPGEPYSDPTEDGPRPPDARRARPTGKGKRRKR